MITNIMSKLPGLWRRKIVNFSKRFFGAEGQREQKKIKEKEYEPKGEFLRTFNPHYFIMGILFGILTGLILVVLLNKL